MENEMHPVHKTKRMYQTCLGGFLVVFSQSAHLHEKISEKNNSHRFRRFREQLLAET